MTPDNGTLKGFIGTSLEFQSALNMTKKEN